MEIEEKEKEEEEDREGKECLILEPFYGGSHQQLIDLLVADLLPAATVLSLPAKKWKWRLRTSAPYFAQVVPPQHSFKTLLCSSMLNLAELIALRQDLASLRKIVYFHENQLEYPCREEKERDVQFGYAQMLTCMVADVVCWNSRYNMTSFLHGLHGKLLRLMPPDQRLDSVAEAIRQKSVVLYYPIVLSLPAPLLSCTAVEKEEGPLHIVWNHRWEWDKGPDQFFKSIFALQQEGLAFNVSVLGEQFGEVPEVFEEARKRLEPHIRHWGFLSSKDAYYKALREADVVVSTALHEFFGVSVVEAIEQGCWPICPNRLVFPEYLPPDHLYNTETQLVKKLRYFARYPGKLRHVKKEKHGGGPVVDLSPFSWNNSLRHRYKALLTLQDE